MVEFENIHVRTEKFHQEVIDGTIDVLSNRLGHNGLSEDVLDRLKASWEKCLIENQNRNLEEAQRRLHEKAKIHMENTDHHANTMNQYFNNNATLNPYYQNPYMQRYNQ